MLKGFKHLICKMRGTRCWQLAVLTTGVNLFLSFTLVMYSFSHTGVHSPPGDPRALLSLEYTGEEGVQTEVETKPSQQALAAGLQNAPAKPENLTPENLNPENCNPENLNPENLNKEYAPLNQHSETQEEFTIQYKPGEGVFDQFRMFKVFDFSKTGQNWLHLGKRHICLGAQTSVDRIYHLVELLGGWTGQLSLAIFTPDLELSVAHKYIQFLSHCYPNLHQQVSFHLVEPVEHPGVMNMDIFNEIHENQVKCEDHKIYLEQLMSYLPKNMSTWRVSYPYPQNLLRNTAKRTCQTEYTYIPDIDMVLPAGIDMQLEKFIESQENCNKCAYVVPTYEIKSDLTSTPKNKNELR
ncbi:beta-1,4-glucuronyltransferase 1 isoform X2 [Eurytemora carolleeae]|uniref:beta-1,4-glucuronyltransferase 1 isoform X2 n=1 Tax=Eurytemora carolleeae TaxID=1294199 RepID=UPI000C7871E7|nr:beta-1,4-glucuronyltransferase 1 isoform X2 [Eurytemora carolleeae]|eukprot:XP_023325775.1 beta-1,4-glucuronyltransferase 1-like isoform X2 [Eurytemora affinis]